jgi:hypothetical protein
MTLGANFKAPIIREWCLLHGLRSCDRKSCLNMLRRPGNSILVGAPGCAGGCQPGGPGPAGPACPGCALSPNTCQSAKGGQGAACQPCPRPGAPLLRLLQHISCLCCAAQLVPGGASEALIAEPGTYDSLLAKRKVRLHEAVQDTWSMNYDHA